MRMLVLFLVVGFSLLSFTTGYAQTRIAVVNSREILTKCNAGAKLVKGIQDKFADRRQEAAKLEQWAGKLQKEASESNIKDARKKDIMAELQQIGDKLQQFTRDVTQEENIQFKPVVDKVNQALGEYAKQKGISGIQDRANYVYVGPDMDITEEIIKKVNQMP
ncbi:hypothetical protein GTA51_19760 [Desulfovibrio aerotolerans]|uniref:OmpH family outer membrane protein n=1 Tax=Solidesulfovibrio aerotolerans TaxID=295255 RepID=A0A7C9MXH6_9BACT|nr:OmpH family outer membrane protein [Solidesulfovibrio aerotolerans]MYL85334.1 hypothetical protein [Solidesulfovibrio aerotolerans]